MMDPVLRMRIPALTALGLCLALPALAQTDRLPPPPDPAALFGSAPAAMNPSVPEVRAQISPRHRTVLSSELSGQIIERTVREGERFRKGQLLIALDCAVHKARLDRAEAAEQAAADRLAVAAKLDQLSSISGLEVQQARSDLTMAKAETQLNQVLVERCRINAPFDGRVGETKASRWQYVAEGEELLELIDDSVLEVEMIVPSAWLSWLKPGHRFTVRIDEVARTVEAEVTRLAARIDPISQSIKVFGRFTGSQDGLLSGMSGTAGLGVPGGPAMAGRPDGAGASRPAGAPGTGG